MMPPLLCLSLAQRIVNFAFSKPTCIQILLDFIFFYIIFLFFLYFIFLFLFLFIFIYFFSYLREMEAYTKKGGKVEKDESEGEDDE